MSDENETDGSLGSELVKDCQNRPTRDVIVNEFLKTIENA